MSYFGYHNIHWCLWGISSPGILFINKSFLWCVAQYLVQILQIVKLQFRLISEWLYSSLSSWTPFCQICQHCIKWLSELKNLILHIPFHIPHMHRNNSNKIYRPQRSCGKVMFSQVCVKNSVHRGGLCPSIHHRSHGQWVGLCPGGSLSRRSLLGRLPLYGNERAVPILLECILVVISIPLVKRLTFVPFSSRNMYSWQISWNEVLDEKHYCLNGDVKYQLRELPWPTYIQQTTILTEQERYTGFSSWTLFC